MIPFLKSLALILYSYSLMLKITKLNPINAVKIKNDLESKSGKCIFPFRYHPINQLKWECIKTKDGNSWCATDVNKGKNMAQNVPIAAGMDDQVWSGKWKWKQLQEYKL